MVRVDNLCTVIDTLEYSDRGELEITDVNNAYIKKDSLFYEILDGWWTDAGTSFPQTMLVDYVRVYGTAS